MLIFFKNFTICKMESGPAFYIVFLNSATIMRLHMQNTLNAFIYLFSLERDADCSVEL